MIWECQRGMKQVANWNLSLPSKKVRPQAVLTGHVSTTKRSLPVGDPARCPQLPEILLWDIAGCD